MQISALAPIVAVFTLQPRAVAGCVTRRRRGEERKAN